MGADNDIGLPVRCSNLLSGHRGWVYSCIRLLSEKQNDGKIARITIELIATTAESRHFEIIYLDTWICVHKIII